MIKSSKKYPKLRSIRITKPRKNKNFILFVCLLTIIAIFQIVLRVNIHKTLSAVEQIEETNNRLVQENALWRIDSTRYTSSEYIRDIAEKKLNMIDASSSPTVLKYDKIPEMKENAGEKVLTKDKSRKESLKLFSQVQEKNYGVIE